jgi:hypothetical protein
MADPTLRRWHDLMAAGGQSASKAAIEIIRSVGSGTTPKAMLSRQLARSVWQDYTGTQTAVTKVPPIPVNTAKGQPACSDS